LASQELLAFATLSDGSGVMAKAAMLEDEPAIPAWQPTAVTPGEEVLLLGSAGVLAPFSGDPVYFGALAADNQLWIGTSGGTPVATPPLDFPRGSALRLTFGPVFPDMQERKVVNVFATAVTSQTGDKRLYKRLLGLPAKFVSDWIDWNKVAAPPAYTA